MENPPMESNLTVPAIATIKLNNSIDSSVFTTICWSAVLAGVAIASVSMLIASCVGAYVAGRMSGLRRKIDGILHGVITWAVSILLALILAMTTGGSLISGLVSNVIQGGIVVAPSGANVASMLNRQLGPTMESGADSFWIIPTSFGRGACGRSPDHKKFPYCFLDKLCCYVISCCTQLSGWCFRVTGFATNYLARRC